MKGTMPETFDIASLDNYTNDTIVSAAGTRVVDGGPLTMVPIHRGTVVARKMLAFVGVVFLQMLLLLG